MNRGCFRRSNAAFAVPAILVSLLVVSVAFGLLAPLLHFERARLVLRHHALLGNVAAGNVLSLKHRVLTSASSPERQAFLLKQSHLFELSGEAMTDFSAAKIFRRKFFEWPGRAPSWAAIERAAEVPDSGCREWRNSPPTISRPNLIAANRTCVSLSRERVKDLYFAGNLDVEQNSEVSLWSGADSVIAVAGSAGFQKELLLYPEGAKSLAIVAIGDISIHRIKRSGGDFHLSLVSLAGSVEVKEFSNTWNTCSSSLETSPAKLFVSAPQEILLGPSVRTAGIGIGCEPAFSPRLWPDTQHLATLGR